MFSTHRALYDSTDDSDGSKIQTVCGPKVVPDGTVFPSIDSVAVAGSHMKAGGEKRDVSPEAPSVACPAERANESSASWCWRA